MARVNFDPEADFDTQVPVVIVGAGAAGLVAALGAAEAGADVVVLERDPLPRGSTALSAGLIPAAATRWQCEHKIDDSASRFAGDIQRKAKGLADQAIVDLVAAAAGPALEWLADSHKLPFSVVADFDYPGHSARRMHGLPTRSGSEFIDRLRAAVETAGVPILANRRVTTLYANHDTRILGVAARLPDGMEERIGCGSLILACNGYGANKSLVAKHIPELANALYFGHSGNEGDAVMWGEALGVALADMSGHQGHGSVAYPHNILITWATMMEGGLQVNVEGERFSDETQGYSEQAAVVLAQTGGIAFSIFDARIAAIARQFEDFRNAEMQGAIFTAATPEALAAKIKVPQQALATTFRDVASMRRESSTDGFGRDWSAGMLLTPPFHAVKVTGALFHTQGGLAIDTDTRVRRGDGTSVENLYAAGGAARGISGPMTSGYLSGNGLVTAVTLGRMAGRQAAARCA